MRAFARRLEIPASVQGVVVMRVDPAGAAFVPAMRRGFVIMEINRQPVRSVADFERLVSAARTGDALAFYGYDPSVGQRAFVLATVDNTMKARILVVDDEAEIRRSVRMILEYEGYDVQEASSGPEALALVEREPPDLVFLDIKMRGLDGLETLQKIRQVERVAAGRDHLRATARSAPPSRRPSSARSTSSRSRWRASACSSRSATRSTRRGWSTRTARSSAPSRRGTRWSARASSLRQIWDAIKRAAPTNATVLLLGRERRRQGAGRARDPSQQPAQPRALHPGQLRRDSRGADRVRALRPREGLVHRRDREADRQVRAGRPRHDLPRRSRRHERQDAGQGPARAAGRRGRAPRVGAHDQGRRPRDRRDQQGPRGGDRARRPSARISISA